MAERCWRQRSPVLRQFGLRAALLTATALSWALLSTQPGKAVDLDLNGIDVTLPAAGQLRR